MYVRSPVLMDSGKIFDFMSDMQSDSLRPDLARWEMASDHHAYMSLRRKPKPTLN
jgi:hypothetical protein